MRGRKKRQLGDNKRHVTPVSLAVVLLEHGDPMSGSITPLPIMLSEEDQAIYDRLEPPKTMVVSYGYQKRVAELPYDGDGKPGCGSKMVIRTQRGTEIGEMLTTTCTNSGCGKSVSRSEMLEYIKNSGGKDYPFSTDGKVLRVATVEDLQEQSRIDGDKTEMIRRAREHARELGLRMKVVEVEPLLGGERVIFYYTSEQWIDFRELVKLLATDFSTRIEMLQVNAREEARLVADYEKCGQQCCCKQFLKVLKPVSMRSAKVQKATLDPQKISGRCGRLMCCLRYEDQTYEQLRKNLPHKKTVVETEDGVGIVIDSQILTQLVLVRIGQSPLGAYPLESVRILTKEEASDWRQKMAEEERERAEAWERRTARRAERSGGSAPRPQSPPAAAPGPAGEDSGDSGQDGEGKKRRRRRRRPRPGQPLGEGEAESREGMPSEQVPNEGGDAQASSGEGGESPEGAPKKRRRRRRRRRGGGGEGGGGGGGEGPPSSDG
ncbi:MAG: regulatory iron-sulfur-containing complex subunit RicT [Phycisphaeraceae bacterium]